MFGSSRFVLACTCVICLGWLMALPASAELTTAEEIFGAALDHLNNGTATVQMVNGWCEVSWDYPKALYIEPDPAPEAGADLVQYAIDLLEGAMESGEQPIVEGIEGGDQITWGEIKSMFLPPPPPPKE